MWRLENVARTCASVRPTALGLVDEQRRGHRARGKPRLVAVVQVPARHVVPSSSAAVLYTRRLPRSRSSTKARMSSAGANDSAAVARHEAVELDHRVERLRSWHQPASSSELEVKPETWFPVACVRAHDHRRGSRRSGVAASALRFYEERRLITSERSPGSGHRRFARPVIRRVAFIVFSAQRVGLSLEEIGEELSKLPADPRAPPRRDWSKLSSAWSAAHRRADRRARSGSRPG